MIVVNYWIGWSFLQHDIGRDGDFDPFTENFLHTVYVYYDRSSQAVAESIASDLVNVYLGHLGVVMANV